MKYNNTLHHNHTVNSFKRGFIACLVLVVVPILASIVVAAQLYVNANI